MKPGQMVLTPAFADRSAANLEINEAAVIAGLAKSFVQERKADAEYANTRQPFVVQHIMRKFAADARARAAAVSDPYARPLTYLPDFDLSVKTAAPVWNEAQRQAALRAAMVESDSTLNARQDALRSAILAGPDTLEFHGPRLDDSQFEVVGEECSPAGIALSYFEASGSLAELITREGGRVIEAKTAEESFAAFCLAVDQTNRLAAACEHVGRRVRFVSPGEDNPDARPVRPAVTFIPFGQPERAVTLPNVQRVNFFPTVAAGRRAPIQRALAYILQREPYARMMTITSGPRDRDDALLENLRDGTKAFHWRLGQVFKHRFFTRHVSLLFRGTEYGTPKAKGWKIPALADAMPAAAWRLHIHSHCIYTPRRRHDGRLWSKVQWGRFREWLRLRLAALARFQEAKAAALPVKLTWADFRTADRAAFSGQPLPQHHAELGQMIHNAAEAVKYPVKPMDLEEMLNNGGPAAICQFADAVRGLHLCQPVGELAALMRRLHERGERIVRVTTPDGSILTVRKDWNRATPANADARDFMNNPGRAARLARLKRAMRPENAARFTRKLNRKTERLARALIADINAKTKKLKSTLSQLKKAQDSLYYWSAKSREAFLDNRIKEYDRASAFQSERATEEADLAARKIALETEKTKLERRFVNLLETFPHALHAAGIDALPAGVLRMMERMTAHCVLPEDEEPAEAPAEDVAAPARRPVSNRLLGITAPCAIAGTRVTQPFAVVVGYQGDFAALTAQNSRIADIANATRAQLTAALRMAGDLDATAANRGPSADARPLQGTHYPPNFPWGGKTQSPPKPAEGWFPALAAELSTAFATV